MLFRSAPIKGETKYLKKGHKDLLFHLIYYIILDTWQWRYLVSDRHRKDKKINVYFLGHHSIVSKVATLIYFIDIYIEYVKLDFIQFFLSILSRKYIFQLQIHNICTKMNYLDIFNNIIQFTVYQYFTYQIILLMSKINLHIIKLIKSCGSCEHIQKSNYLKKKFICHCHITVIVLLLLWIYSQSEPEGQLNHSFLIKLSLFWRPYLEFVDT